jgi:hypothetical protein
MKREPAIGWRGLFCLAMLVASASCVPAAGADSSHLVLSGAVIAVAPAAIPAAADAPPPPEPMLLQDVSPTDAVAINAGIPLSNAPNPGAPPMLLRASGGLDRLRAEDCLARAVYYEARSESEDGQRAVAQVVLNRVRHPAFPNSVCGVVYQGPQRAGGGCQFTFTCDGSLASPAGGPAWDRARRIAAEALAGYVYAPVGAATHYHNQQVVPAWAFRLIKSAVIGAHDFYRLPGAWGEAAALRRPYGGREPAPSTLIATRLPSFVPARRGPGLPIETAALRFAAAEQAPAAPPRPNDRLPVSQVRDEFKSSGQWLDQPRGAIPVTR